MGFIQGGGVKSACGGAGTVPARFNKKNDPKVIAKIRKENTLVEKGE